jgi:hypothetical protein
VSIKVPDTQQHAHEPSVLGYVPSDAPNVISREWTSHLHKILAMQVANNNLKRPITAAIKSGLQQ